MLLNEFGKIAEQELLKTTDIRENVEIDSFVVMPNHVHFIVHIKRDAARRGKLHLPEKENNEMQMGECNVLNETGECNGNIQMGECNHGECNINIQTGECNAFNKEGECNSPLPPHGTSQTVGAIVRGYKSAVTKQLNALGFSGKLWQRNYYEHIIRTPESYERIANYIAENPVRWEKDKFHD